LRARRDHSLRPEDAALARELIFGVLRWQRLLDALLARNIRVGVRTIEPDVRLALRLGIYQLRFLDRVPAHAAVDQCVELVKRAGKNSAAGLVNAVLRRSAGESMTPAEKLLPGGIPPVERLAILHSHPTWMVERWLARFGEAETTALLAANNRPAPAALALGDHDAESVRAEFEQRGIHTEPGALLKSALRVTRGNAEQTEAFRTGKISYQDEASQSIPRLLGVRAGDMVLDLCAAPGGKTAILAVGALPGGSVVAADIQQARLRSMRENLARVGALNVVPAVLDGENPLPFSRNFDRVLADVPCSGTGTLARNPEIRWRLQPEAITALAARQTKLLVSALAQLAPGGRLIYSTCSLEPEENENVIAAALEDILGTRRVTAGELRRLLQPYLAGGVDAYSVIGDDGVFRTLPQHAHTDGFFAVALERSSE
jgi:16S rRNA (cytosine967-C5)-methyltransferase